MAVPPFSAAPAVFNGAKASPEVAAAIHKASARTGVDFKYLVAQAGQESSFRPDAKAATSTAKGLYQFIERTWLHMVRDKGAEHGLGHLAGQIADGGDAPQVADPALRRQILDLRNDPSIAALMAAEYAKSNRDQLEAALGRGANSTDLYMAHFLGAAGATRFLGALEKTPDQLGATLLPEAAAANRGAFYDKAGRALSVKQIYAAYAAKFDAIAHPAPAQPVSSAAAAPPPRVDMSPASMVKAAIFEALAGQQLAPVTIDALMKLGVPGALTRAERDDRKG